MSSKAAIKRIRALHRKKGRSESGLAIAQGTKVIKELLSSDLQVVEFHLRKDVHESFQGDWPLIEATQGELNEMATLEHGVNAVAVFKIPKEKETPTDTVRFAFDAINDPGNLGTIIRSAENFGVGGILLGEGCVDPWNPKCVQSSMGSVFRMPIWHQELESLNDEHRSLFTAEMEGEDLFATEVPDGSIIVFGNETHGVTVSLNKSRKLTIPTTGNAESLNVGMAATIFAAELYRRKLKS